jgi:hypothetical protein
MFYYNAIALGNRDPEFIKEYIIVEALIAGVDPQIAIGVAKRESGFNNQADGDSNKSHGLWQIYLPAHPEITKEMAHNIVFSTQWSMNEMKKNGCHIWSVCEKVMDGLSSP